MIIVLLIFIAIERLCFWETKGFRLHKIVSALPYDSQWESVNPPADISALLNQPYFFIGSGGTCYSFVSQDGQTVIKFFKHQHLLPNRRLKCLPGFLDTLLINWSLAKEKQFAHKRIDFLFKSCKIAHDELKNQTGIIHLQLNKSPKFKQNLILYDKIGCRHTIDLSNTEFVLQKRATLVYDLLKQWQKEGNIEKSQRCIDQILSLIIDRHKRGIADRDPNVEINFGMADNRIIEIDVGSFSRVTTARPLNEELASSTLEFQEWLGMQYPELQTYLKIQIASYEPIPKL